MRRAKIWKYSWICTILPIVIFAWSCASVEDNPQQYGINVKRLNADEIRAISNLQINPYIEPSSIIRGKIDEFIVVRIEFSVEREMLISISSDLKDRNGKHIPIYYVDDLLAYWDQFRGSNDKKSIQDFIKKQNLIKQTCIPDSQFRLRPGRYVYYLVFIGPYPIKMPVQGKIEISSSSGAYDLIQIDIE